MNTDSYGPSEFYTNFTNDIHKISNNESDSFHYSLYFSYVVSSMEKYLHDVFIHEISSDRKKLIKLATLPKFSTQTLKLPFVLNNNIDDFIINSMKNFVWHRVTDVDVFYRQVLGIEFNLSGKLLLIIETRHDIIHRNSYDNDGNKVTIEKEKLNECVRLIHDFISGIDKKYCSLRT